MALEKQGNTILFLSLCKENRFFLTYITAFVKGIRKSLHIVLNRMESVVTNGTIITYALWSSGPAVHGASTPWMMLTVPFVLYGIFRYLLLSDPQEIERRNPGLEQGGESERPEEMLLNDCPLLLTVVGWGATAVVILLLDKLHLIH